MSGFADMVTGRASRTARRAQQMQEAAIEDEKRRLRAIEEGQRLAGQVGGGGLLAYTDGSLRDTLGG